MNRTARVLGTVCLAVLMGTQTGCKDSTARNMARQVADSLVAYGVRNGNYLSINHQAVCNLDKSIWDVALNPDPADPTTTLIKPMDPVLSTALCPPGSPVRGVPPDDPEDPF